MPDISLKEYYDAVLAERDSRMEQRFQSLQLAVTKAEVATEKRFEGVNEFRNTLADQQRTFMPRTETESMFTSHSDRNEQMFKTMDDKLNVVAKKLDKIENMKQGGNVVWAYVISIVSLIATLLAIIMYVSKFGAIT